MHSAYANWDLSYSKVFKVMKFQTVFDLNFLVMECLKEPKHLGKGQFDLKTLAYFEVSIAFFVQTPFFFIPAFIQKRFFLLLLPLHLPLQELQNHHHQKEVPLVLHQYIFESKEQALLTGQ